MSINYKMIFRGDYLNPNEKKKTGFYPHVVRKSTVSIKDLAEKISFGKRLGALEPDEIRAEFISVKRVGFTPSKALKGNMRMAKFVRGSLHNTALHAPFPQI